MRIAFFLLLAGCSSSAQPDDGGSGTDATTTDVAIEAANDSAIADAGTEASPCIAAINQYRALVDAAPVVAKMDQEMCAADQAKKGAADLADSGMTTFHKYFGQCAETYQNECWYSVDDIPSVVAWCMKAFYDEGPPEAGINHYSVMTDPKSTKVACGFAHRTGGGYWMTNDFY